MDDEEGSSSRVETAKADRSVWLMKCPVVVAKSWQSHPPSDTAPIAKVVLSLDPLRPPDDPSSHEVLFFLSLRLLSVCKIRALGCFWLTVGASCFSSPLVSLLDLIEDALRIVRFCSNFVHFRWFSCTVCVPLVDWSYTTLTSSLWRWRVQSQATLRRVIP